MRFISIYKISKASPNFGKPPSQEHMAEMGQLIEREMKAGVLIGTEGLKSQGLTAGVRLDRGEYNVTDGPFSEAREVIGGYAILNVKTKAEAIEAAKRFLGVVKEGTCELHELHEMGDFDPK